MKSRGDEAMPEIKKTCLCTGAALAIVLASAPALAWEPTKPVEIVVAAGAGGASDQMARMMQAAVQKNNLMKQPMVVSLKGGASGAGAKFAYLPYKSGGEAATQLVGNHTASNVNNPSENLEVWRAGQVRPLCVFDKDRIEYKTKVTADMSWNDIPTCKEQGLDVQYLMLRAMFLPGKVTPEQTAFYVDLFKKLTQTPEYKDYMEKQALKPVFLTGKDMLKFLEEDDALNKKLMTEAGFVAH
jgi:tripartite-type tricarboxylate transporter receptor subunit TctC